jgi:hypothetical protein
MSSIARSWALALVAMTACAHSKIPMTQIDDTEDNRQILAIVEEYKRAMESLDAPAVLSLVSPHYYEDNGNIATADDYDFAGLKTSLEADFARTKTMHLDLRVDAIAVDEGSAYAELYYQVRAHNGYPSGEKWETGNDRTRIEFEKVGDKWLIVSGL